MREMFKFFIITCLITKTHSWTWDDYPSPRGTTYWKCGVSKQTYLCDPDEMLSEQQRKEIVELIEDFKEKTKRPNSIYSCLREGLRLVVALARDKVGPEDGSDKTTYLCENDRNWTAYDYIECMLVHGIELNRDGFRYCNLTRHLLHLRKEDFEKLEQAWKNHLYQNHYYDALRHYIRSLRMLYIDRFSIFDNQDASNEDNITLSEVHHSLQTTNKTLSEMRQSLDQQNKKSTEFSTSIEDLNKKFLEMRQVQDQILIGKNITTLTRFPSSKQFSNNLWVLFCINTRGVVGSRNS
ncbi:unnamed protein product [Meloidogyne enterolobii]|uniref:Uncharacterized protein n=2 Tax=Meloidogyne enterolobii TaxID=390850 RepID=A0ACB1AUB6_MELEN|nr:unnamed protein product [Meloidogyne enterolobii]